MEVAGDVADEALGVVTQVARHQGFNDEVEVLHRSNNVVARVGPVVLKAGIHGSTAMDREVALAAEGAVLGAPVLRPLSGLRRVGRFQVSTWPFIDTHAPPAAGAVARALRRFHAVMARSRTDVPSVEDSLLHSAEFAEEATSLSATEPWVRELLAAALRRAADEVRGRTTTLVHGEPHGGNVLARGEEAVLIDLESAKRAPVEWDLAFLSPDDVAMYWPEHDVALLGQLRVAVSAQVATYCWRHVSARPDDSDIRWHADYHLCRVMDATR